MDNTNFIEITLNTTAEELLNKIGTSHQIIIIDSTSNIDFINSLIKEVTLLNNDVSFTYRIDYEKNIPNDLDLKYFKYIMFTSPSCYDYYYTIYKVSCIKENIYHESHYQYILTDITNNLENED